MSDHSARRTWTDSQLAQKRQQDRWSQRRTRAETKERIENIEKDISCLRGSMEELLTYFYGEAPPAVEYFPSRNIQVGHVAPANSTFVSWYNCPK